MVPHRERQEQAQLDAERGERHEQAVVGDRGRGSPARARPAGCDIFTAMAMITGHDGEHGQAGEVAPAAEDQPQLRAQEPQRPAPHGRPSCCPGARPGGRSVRRGAAPPAPRQPLTSKPSPVSETNRSSRLGRCTAKPRHRHAVVDQGGDDLLGRERRRACADTLPLVHQDVGQAELAQHPRGGVPLVGLHPRPRRRARAHLGDGTLGHEPADVHDADVGADLLDLGEQVGGDQDGGALVGERGDQVPDLAGALRVEAVGRLVEHQQVAGPEQGRGDREPLAHAERVGAVALGRRGRRPTRSSAASIRAPVVRGSA